MHLQARQGVLATCNWTIAAYANGRPYAEGEHIKLAEISAAKYLFLALISDFTSWIQLLLLVLNNKQQKGRSTALW